MSRSGGGGGSTGRAKGKKFEDVGELPDPDQFQGAVANPAAEDAPAGRARAGDRVVDETAKALKNAEFAEALKKIGMSEYVFSFCWLRGAARRARVRGGARLTRQRFDARKYDKYKTAVATEIRELRTVLEGLESRDQERMWQKNSSTGDLDDGKLIDGLTGDRNIYMRRKCVVAFSRSRARGSTR